MSVPIELLLENSVNKAIEVAAWIASQRSGTLDEAGRQKLQEWLDANAANQLLFSELSNVNSMLESVSGLQKIDTDAVLKRVIPRLRFSDVPKIPITRPFLFRISWMRYAAVVLLVLGSGSYLLLHTGQEKLAVVQRLSQAPVFKDIPAGGNKAMLTLADGSTIVLDNAANGQLTTQGNTIIIKRQGEIIYNIDASSTGQATGMNTMSTPRGGQYQLKLPDGSLVWLNAASSITYPTVFSGPKRQVSVTGEAYFEITADLRRPFEVVVNKETGIEVLGTHFNVNAYGDESNIKTTLLEGAVRLRSREKNQLLRPGQQGQVQAGGSIELDEHVDVEQVMAWKNGFFNFENIGLQEMLKQLSRWYDIDVTYEKDPPPIVFGGEMGRDVPLSKVLSFLEKAGVHFRIDQEHGKLVIIR